ncbi:MAG: type II toxin-antitoxin system VapC family toxin [Actinobacteria bacterium]|nr:type II toxin-antitoxin system VapC family toxin [Actinomycetota bacterium]
MLLDTHAFIWWVDDTPSLGASARQQIDIVANTVFVSAASAWEIAIKRSGGTLEAPQDVEQWIADEGFSELPIQVRHGVVAGGLPLHHRDPFDRMLVAQAQVEGMVLVTADDVLEEYDVEILRADR